MEIPFHRYLYCQVVKLVQILGCIPVHFTLSDGSVALYSVFERSLHNHNVNYSLKTIEWNSICHWRHSLGGDVCDHFFWSEYRVNRTRFHSLNSEFSLNWSWNRVKIHSSTNEISSLDFFESIVFDHQAILT